MSKGMKMLSIILATMLAVTLLASVTFVSCKSHHECHGAACPICAMLEVAEAVLTKLSCAVIFVALTVSMCVLAQKCRESFELFRTYTSPVTLKVKMLN